MRLNWFKYSSMNYTDELWNSYKLCWQRPIIIILPLGWFLFFGWKNWIKAGQLPRSVCSVMEHRNLNCDDRQRRLCRFSKHNCCCNQQNMKIRPTKCGMGMLWRTGCNISWLASISRLGLGSWPMFFAFQFVDFVVILIPVFLMRSPHVLVAEYPHFGQTAHKQYIPCTVFLFATVESWQ